MNAFSAVATFYKEGGMFMHAVLVIAVVIIAIVVERAIVIGRAAATDGRKLADDLVRRIGQGDLAGARHLVMGMGTPAGKVAQAALHSSGSDEASIQSAADDAATLVMPDLTRRIAHMGMLANSATLIGLLGTISGLITAISGVGVADAAQRSAHLASGISEALHTTAFGLTIAIPALLLQGWLSGRVEVIADQMDELSIRLSRAVPQAASRGAVAQVSALQHPRGTATHPQTTPVARAATGSHAGGR